MGFDTIGKNNTTKWEIVRNAFEEKISEMGTLHPDFWEAKTNMGHIVRFLFPSSKPNLGEGDGLS